MKDILCIGSALIDYTVWPANPERILKEHFQVDVSQPGMGGCGGNASLCFASLGKSTSLVARIGTGPLSDLARGFLTRGGVDLDLMAIDPDRDIGRTLVLVSDDGERRFLYKPGANAHLSPEDCKDLDYSQFHLVHITDIFLLNKMKGAPLETILKEARMRGAITSMDTVWDPSGLWFKTLGPKLPFLDYLFVSDEEADMMFPNMDPNTQVNQLLKHMDGTVVLKRGAKGCLIGRGETRIAITPEPIQPVDTTGAGDAFAASFMACILEEMDLKEAGQIATWFAGEVIGFLGATSGLKRHASARAFADYRRDNPA